MSENVHGVEDDQVGAGEDLQHVEDVDDDEGFEDLRFGECFPGGFCLV